MLRLVNIISIPLFKRRGSNLPHFLLLSCASKSTWGKFKDRCDKCLVSKNKQNTHSCTWTVAPVLLHLSLLQKLNTREELFPQRETFTPWFHRCCSYLLLYFFQTYYCYSCNYYIINITIFHYFVPPPRHVPTSSPWGSWLSVSCCCCTLHHEL